jgi:chaperonin GroEL (HSP60 family)
MDDIATKYLVEAGVIGLRRVDKHDLRRIAKATGGKYLLENKKKDIDLIPFSHFIY